MPLGMAITEGRPQVTDVAAFGMDEAALVSLTAAAEKKSEHPLGAAIVEYAARTGAEQAEAESFASVTGNGIRAIVRGKTVLVGKAGFLRDNGVDNVLALRGDIPKGQDIDWETAEFRHAADLVRFAKAHYPDMGIGVAGYPAPHPESPSFASDWRYTVAKIREGADFVITQLFFDVREYLHFVDRLSDMGVSVPVIPGILPIQSLESIRRTLSLCGV